MVVFVVWNMTRSSETYLVNCLCNFVLLPYKFVQVRDKELVGVEQMRVTLLEMASGHRALNLTTSDGPGSLQQSPISGERILDTANEGPLP